MDAIQRHADYARALPELTPVWRQVYKREAGDVRDVDENLYGGFVSNNDRKVLTKLRRMSADQLSGEMAFSKTRNWPSCCSATGRAIFRARYLVRNNSAGKPGAKPS